MIHEEIFQWGENFPYKECLSYWNVFGYNYSVMTINPKEWRKSNFSLKYHPWIKQYGHVNKANDQKFKKLVIVRQIFLVGTRGNE